MQSASDQVYVIDDDSMVRRSLSFSLTTAGYKVRPFASGSDFIAAVDTLLPGCVLLDIRMPGMDGLAVLDKIGGRIDRFAVVAMTGHGDVDTAVRAMKRGARDFLEKPFTDATVLDVLENLAASLGLTLDRDLEREDALARVATLTPREHQVLRGLIGGMPNKILAHRLNISVRTVEMHRAKVMERLGVKSVAEAIRIGICATVSPL